LTPDIETAGAYK